MSARCALLLFKNPCNYPAPSVPIADFLRRLYSHVRTIRYANGGRETNEKLRLALSSISEDCANFVAGEILRMCYSGQSLQLGPGIPIALVHDLFIMLYSELSSHHQYAANLCRALARR